METTRFWVVSTKLPQPLVCMQGRVFVVCYAYGQAANWQHLEDAARQAIAGYRHAPYGSELYPCPAELAARVVR